jgi:hypothetical protein
MQARWSNFFLHRWQIGIMHETRQQLKKRSGKFGTATNLLKKMGSGGCRLVSNG